MRRILLLVVLLGFLWLPHVVQGQNMRRAWRHWEQQEWQALKELVYNELAHDELAPGEQYLFSRLYTHAEGYIPALDSAHYWIVQAQGAWARSDERLQEKYGKFAITDSVLQAHHQWVDSAAFAEARIQNTEAAYTYFLTTYGDALQVENATTRRYALAFARASQANTYLSYQAFWNQYPQAPQVAEARERAQRVAYSTETASGTVESYRRFIQKYPNSPYVAEAEGNILALSTLDFSAASFRNFIETYPNSPHRQRAISVLFHLEKEQDRIFPLLGSITQWPEWDSLLTAAKLEQGRLFPIWQDTSYRMWNPVARIWVQQRYDNLPDTVCSTGWPHPWFPVRQHDDRYKLVTRDGQALLQNTVLSVEDLGLGLMAIEMEEGWGVRHLGGFWVLPPQYEEVLRLGNGWLAADDGDGWRFFSALGKVVPLDVADDFEVLGPYLLLQRGEYWGVGLIANLAKRIKGESVEKIEYAWEDFELLPRDELWLFGQDQEAILDATGAYVVRGPYELEDVGFGWLAESNLGYGLVLHGNRGLLPPFYKAVQQNRGWLALKEDRKWALIDPNVGFAPKYEYDSVRVLGEDVFYVEESGQRRLQLGDSVQLVLRENQQFRVLPDPEGGDALDWIYLKDADSARVITSMGKAIWRGKPSASIARTGAHFLSITEKGKTGLWMAEGRWAVPMEYGGIGQANEVLIPILKDGKFGAYWLTTDKVTKAIWERVPIAYSDTLAIAQLADKFGVFGASGQQLIPAQYDEIRYWNDTAALVRQGYAWEIRNVRNDSLLWGELLQVSPWQRGEFLIKTSSGFGLVHPTRGTLIEPELDVLEWIGPKNQGFWRGENYVPAAAWYVYSYFDGYGIRLYRQVVDEQKVDAVFCE